MDYKYDLFAAAQYLGLPLLELPKLIKGKELEAIIADGRVHFTRDSLEQYLGKQTEPVEIPAIRPPIERPPEAILPQTAETTTETIGVTLGQEVLDEDYDTCVDLFMKDVVEKRIAELAQLLGNKKTKYLVDADTRSLILGSRDDEFHEYFQNLERMLSHEKHKERIIKNPRPYLPDVIEQTMSLSGEYLRFKRAAMTVQHATADTTSVVMPAPSRAINPNLNLPQEIVLAISNEGLDPVYVHAMLGEGLHLEKGYKLNIGEGYFSSDTWKKIVVKAVGQKKVSFDPKTFNRHIRHLGEILYFKKGKNGRVVALDKKWTTNASPAVKDYLDFIIRQRGRIQTREEE